jgi:hypothetical protein
MLVLRVVSPELGVSDGCLIGQPANTPAHDCDHLLNNLVPTFDCQRPQDNLLITSALHLWCHSRLMSGNVRARRPASPPAGVAHAAPIAPQRFPHPRDDHLDADARRAAASKGFAPGRTTGHPSGGLNMTTGEWRLLFFIVLVAAGVRLFRLSKPNSVV